MNFNKDFLRKVFFLKRKENLEFANNKMQGSHRNKPKGNKITK